MACFPSCSGEARGWGDPRPLPAQLCSLPGPGSGAPWFRLLRVGALQVPPSTEVPQMHAAYISVPGIHHPKDRTGYSNLRKLPPPVVDRHKTGRIPALLGSPVCHPCNDEGP